MKSTRKASIKKALKHIRDYYTSAVVIAILAVTAIAFLAQDILKQQSKAALYIAIIDCTLPEADINQLKTEAETLLNVNPKTERCIIESNYSGQQNASGAATTAAYMRTGQVDIVIAPEESFNRYAAADYLLPLDDTELKEQLNAKSGDELFYASLYDYSKPGAVLDIPFAPHEAKDGASCYGIYLDDTVPQLQGYVIGIMKNAAHMENAKTVCFQWKQRE